MNSTKQPSTPDARLPLDLDALPRMTMDQLRELWPKHMGRAPPPVQKRLMVRELAWRVQERIYGGLDAETRRLLNAAVRAVNAEIAGGNKERPRRRAGSVVRPQRAILPTSTRLVRTWQGQAHEVLVLSSGGTGNGGEGGGRFKYRGKQYKSLSEIARLITGARWSGPRFFGLTKEDGTP
ncbi:MAG: DUF2924 domain-containing protein [Phycisphaerales bacterium]|nr:DUF2924 domain-containing protein [Phycisphaerales bacterium]